MNLLRSFMLSEKSYEFSTDPNEVILKPCMPLYGARLIFASEQGTVTTNFCFGCYILLFSLNDAALKEANFKSRAFAQFFNRRFADDGIASKFE